LVEYKNPNYEVHHIDVPFRMCVEGGSGSCKTTFVLDLIHKMDKTFSEVVFVVKSKDEPYYKHLDSDEMKSSSIRGTSEHAEH